jgi:hypothetical protein
MIRAVAGRTDTVGKSLLVSSLPVGHVPIDAVRVRLAGPDFNEPTFLFIPAGAHDGVYYSANVAGDGIALTGSP